MAKQVIGAEVSVDFQSVGNLRKAIKEANSELLKTQAAFGATSKEAIEAAKRVAGLRDALKEANEVADLFDPGNKFKAVGNAVTALASGFTAVQGALGLLGVESKEVEKQLLRVQSALALSQGLSGILDSGKDFQRLASIIKGPVVAAFTTLRGALSAVGIGLIISAVAFLVQNFEKVKKVIYDLFPGLEGLFDNFDRIKQIAFGVGNAVIQFITAPIKALIKVFKGDFQGALDEVKNGIAFTKNFREGEQKEIKSQADEREKLRQEELKKQQEANAAKLAEQRRINEELRKERERAEKEYTDFLQKERERQLTATFSSFEKELFELDKKYKAAYDLAKKYNFDLKELEALRLQEVVDVINKETEVSRTGFDSKLNIGAEFLPKIAAQTSSITANEQTESKIRVGIAQTEADNKLALLQVIGGGLSELANIAGQQTAFGKTLAIGQIAIDTALAISSLVKNSEANPTNALTFGTSGIIQFASGIVRILANIGRAKSILSSKNTPTSFTPVTGGNTTAPLTPQLSVQAQGQALNAQAINNLQQNPTRAYILDRDIQNQNQVNSFITRNANI